jgi:flagellar basal-body rod protein FlgB
MDPKRIGLFDLAERRLAWADQRQAVLAQNIANANTPGFTPHELKPFATTLDATATIAPVRTQSDHLSGTGGAASSNGVVDRTHLKSPDGNAVALDEQLVKLADTETTHALVTTIYKKYLGMFNMALGRSSSG